MFIPVPLPVTITSIWAPLWRVKSHPLVTPRHASSRLVEHDARTHTIQPSCLDDDEENQTVYYNKRSLHIPGASSL